jgi:hypothetical protein
MTLCQNVTTAPGAALWTDTPRHECARPGFSSAGASSAPAHAAEEAPRFDFSTGPVIDKQDRRSMGARREASVSLARLARPVGTYSTSERKTTP